MTESISNETYKAEVRGKAAEYYEQEREYFDRKWEEAAREGNARDAAFFQQRMYDSKCCARYCRGEKSPLEGQRFGEDWLNVRYETWSTIKFLKGRGQDSEVYKNAVFVYNEVMEEKGSLKDELYYISYVTYRAFEQFSAELDDVLNKIKP